MDWQDPNTIEMTKKVIRQALPFIGGGLTIIGMPHVAAGVGAVFNNYDTILSAVGVLLGAGSTIWMAVNNTKAAQTARVDAFPEVAGVIMKATPEAYAISDKIPDPIVVGTAKAQQIASVVK